MTSYTLNGGTYSRGYSGEALASYSVNLLASSQGHFKVDGVVFILLSPKGFLFVLQVDGTGSTPGRALLESYNFGWNTALEHNIELTDKSGLSGTYTLSQALAAHGHTFTTLDALHAFVYAEPPPGPPRYWSVDNSEDITQLVRKTTHNHAHRSTYLAPPEEHPSVQTKRQTINHFNSYTHAFTVDNLVVTALDLAGLSLENVSGTRYRLGVTALATVITISQSSPYTVEAAMGSTLTVPSASATDPVTGNALSVTASPATVSLGALATHVVTYTCQTSAGDLSSELLTLVVQDSTPPQLVLLGSSTVNLIVGDTYGAAEDAGAQGSDNHDGDLTSSIVTSGLPVDTSAASTQTATYSVVDSQNLSASISRSIVIAPPYTWQAGAIYGYGSGNPTGASPQYVSHTIQPSAWRGPSAAQAADPDLVFERAYATHSAGNATLGLGPATLSSSFDGIVYDLGSQHFSRMVIKGSTFQGQVLDSGSNRLALYLEGSNSATGPWTVIAYQQSPYWPGLLNPPQTFSYNHPASSTTNHSTAYRYIAVGYGVVSGSISTNTPDSGVSRICLTGDFYA